MPNKEFEKLIRQGYIVTSSPKIYVEVWKRSYGPKPLGYTVAYINNFIPDGSWRYEFLLS